MKELFDQWRKQSESQKKPFTKMLKGLNSKQAKRIGELGGQLHEEVFTEIDCLACANCCKSIPPILNETDIRRLSKALGMKVGDFEAQYVTVDDDYDRVIKGRPCPFLEKDNSCRVYDDRPRACRQYPHTDTAQFADSLRLHATNSIYCPAVFHILNRMNAGKMD